MLRTTEARADIVDVPAVAARADVLQDVSRTIAIDVDTAAFREHDESSSSDTVVAELSSFIRDLNQDAGKARGLFVTGMGLRGCS